MRASILASILAIFAYTSALPTGEGTASESSNSQGTKSENDKFQGLNSPVSYSTSSSPFRESELLPRARKPKKVLSLLPALECRGREASTSGDTTDFELWGHMVKVKQNKKLRKGALWYGRSADNIRKEFAKKFQILGDNYQSFPDSELRLFQYNITAKRTDGKPFGATLMDVGIMLTELGEGHIREVKCISFDSPEDSPEDPLHSPAAPDTTGEILHTNVSKSQSNQALGKHLHEDDGESSMEQGTNQPEPKRVKIQQTPSGL